MGEQKLSVENLHQLAEKHLVDGQYDEAKETYIALSQLAADPRVYYKGYSFLECALGNAGDGLRLLEQYLEVDEKDIEAWQNLSVLYAKREEHARAEQALQKVVALCGAKTDVATFLQLIKSQYLQKNLKAQIKTINRALQAYPDDEKLQGIELELRKVLKQDLPQMSSSGDIEQVFLMLHRWQAVEEQITLGCLIRVITELAKSDEQSPLLLKHLEKEVDEMGGNFLTFIAMGIALHQMEKPAEAVNWYKGALRIKPNHITVKANLGIVLRRTQNYAEARQVLESAYKDNKKLANVTENLAICCSQSGDLDAAVGYYEETIKLMPDSHKARFSLGIVQLLRGNYEEGWKHYSHRMKELNYRSIEEKVARWFGEDVTGKHVLIMNEQGFGDTINFIRYMPLLAKRCRKASVYVQKALLPLCKNLREIPENCEFVEINTEVKAVDHFAPLLDAAAHLDTNFSNVPYQDRYFDVPAEEFKRWQEKFEVSEKLRIGIAWRGSIAHKRDKERSMELSKFEPLLFDKRCQFYNLLVGHDKTELRPYRDVIEDYTNDISNFLDSAAMISQLDLIVTVDTSIAHLAGALGIPTWVLVNHVPDWRWLMEGQSTHWYESVRLFRETEVLNWEPVLKNLYSTFQQWVDSKS